MAIGLIAGALLGALDLLAMEHTVRRAARLGSARGAAAVARRGAAARMACIFGLLALGAACLSRVGFFSMAGAYVAARLCGLFVIAARSSRGAGTVRAARAGTDEPRARSEGA